MGIAFLNVKRKIPISYLTVSFYATIILALGSVVLRYLNSPTASINVPIARGSFYHNFWEQLLRNIVRPLPPHPPTHIQTVWPECVHREISPHSFPRGSLFTYSQSVNKLSRPVRSRKAGRGRRGQADLYLLYPYLYLYCIEFVHLSTSNVLRARKAEVGSSRNCKLRPTAL